MIRSIFAAIGALFLGACAGRPCECVCKVAPQPVPDPRIVVGGVIESGNLPVYGQQTCFSGSGVVNLYGSQMPWCEVEEFELYDGKTWYGEEESTDE